VGWITLSPKAYRWWTNFTATHHYGDGYTVDFISHSAVRYREEARSITLSSEPLTRPHDGGKTDWVLAVYVHRPLKWDEPILGEVTDPVEEETDLMPLPGCEC
jgi:hypothetical protein